MKLDCGIIRDLLPLYSDNVCSDESKSAVEEHLKECEKCRDELKSICDEKTVSLLRREGDTLIIGKYRRILLSKIVFFLVCVLAIPLVNGIFTFTIVSDAVYEVVLITVISMLTFVYIPAVARKNRFVWIVASSVLAPVIQMWYFGTFERLGDYSANTWEYGNEVLLIWLLPSFAYILFSLVMFLLNRKKKPLDPFQYRTSAFKAVITEAFCLYYCGYVLTLMNMSGGYFDFVIMMGIITFCVIFLWLAFLVFRFCKKNIFIRLGAYSVISGIFMSNWEPVYKSAWSHLSGAYWYYSYWLEILILSLIVAAIFFVAGIVWEKSKKNKRL